MIIFVFIINDNLLSRVKDKSITMMRYTTKLFQIKPAEARQGHIREEQLVTRL